MAEQIPYPTGYLNPIFERRRVMHRTALHFFCISLFLLLPAACNGSDGNMVNGVTDYRVETVLSGLEHPWGMIFLPGRENLALVTERPGRLNLVDVGNGEIHGISGIPEVAAVGQGGLLDVAVHPEFTENNLVYLSYTAGGDDPGQYATHVARGRLDLDGRHLVDLEVLLVAVPFSDSDAHFGSRMVFDDENRLYVTSGDRRDRYSAQDLTGLHGKTLRIHDNGDIPPDNPFIDIEDAHPAIFSYGHRNAQGMAVQPGTGDIWQNEHGEYAGDEINVIVKGGNFGWPIATYGREYTDQSEIGILPPEHEETVDPVYYWAEEDGFPPSGMAFYQGTAFENWEGDLLVGGLRDQYIARFEVNGTELFKKERILENRGWRIRDVRVNPADGFLYVLVDNPDAPLVRVRPAQETGNAR